MTDTIPTPGSDLAVKQGCTCPIVDNGYGKGCGYVDKQGEAVFYFNAVCPLHCPADGGKKTGGGDKA